MIRKTSFYIISCLMMLFATETKAQEAITDTVFQRRLTVIDQETRLPLSGVSVRIDNGTIQHTDYLGHITITNRFDSISFSHFNYNKEKLYFYELSDTMMLFPHHNMLQEVVVTGIGPDLRKAMKRAHDRMMSQPTAKGLEFDLASMLDKRGRRDKKHLQKAKEILREWDAAPTHKEK